MFKSLLERMNIVNMVFKADQWFGVLLLCFSTLKAGGKLNFLFRYIFHSKNFIFLNQMSQKNFDIVTIL